jgi:phosphoserine phosphatase RsbX
VEAVTVLRFEAGMAQFVLPGQRESGDRHIVSGYDGLLLIAAIDGIGHGEEAAEAAEAAASILRSGICEPIIRAVERCHERLRQTRGVVLSLASVNVGQGMMTWLGVGNVQGVLVRAGRGRETRREVLLLRGGVIGSRMPPLQAAVLPFDSGDTIAFATDGLRGDCLDNLTARDNPQRAAERIVEHYRTGQDDALALVVRLMGNGS